MSGRRVLIVDDNVANVALAAFVLNDAGFVVDSESDASTVSAKVASFRPDLVLMDIRLSGADGLELARALRFDPATRHVVIVAFTAHAMKGDEARMLAAGCDAYIAKPIDVATFAGLVGRALAAGQRTGTP